MQFEGKVTNVQSIVRGTLTFHNVSIDSAEHNFGLGFRVEKPVWLEQGVYVKFDADQNDKGFWNMNKGSLEQVATTATGPSTSVTRSAGHDSRQLSIMSQTCMKVAADVVLAGVAADKIKVPAKASYLDIVHTHITDISHRLP